MPTYDFTCDASDCGASGTQFEGYLRRCGDPNPACPSCGRPLKRLLAAPASVFLRPWGAYGDPRKEGYDPNNGVVAYRTKSSRHLDGTPERVVLNTYQDVKTYCRDEGLRDPGDLPNNLEVAKDGKALKRAGNIEWV